MARKCRQHFAKFNFHTKFNWIKLFCNFPCLLFFLIQWKIFLSIFNVLFLSLIVAMFYLWMLHCSFFERRQKLSVFGEVFLQKVRYFLIRKSAGVISIFIQRKDIKSVNVNWHSRAKRIDQVRKFDILSV